MARIYNELRNYQNVPRELVFDKDLSDRARFVYVFMACKPDGWDFFLEPMAKEIKYSVDTLRKYINELVANGWLVKGEQSNEHGIFGAVEYTLKATKNTDTEKYRHGKNNAQDNKDISLPNTEDNPIKEEIKKENIKRNRNEYSEDFEKAWELAQRKGSKTEAYKYWKRLKEEDKKKVFAHLPFYYKSNERRYLKDFSGYLNRCYYSSVVYDKQGHVLYDPEREQSNEYRPICDVSLVWNEYWHCYMYVGFWDGKHIPDGYSDDNRPDGASVTLNNGRGVLTWDKETKQWRKR